MQQHPIRLLLIGVDYHPSFQQRAGLEGKDP